MKPFEMLGYWWLPKFDNCKVPGVLKFTYEKGLELKIIPPKGESFLFNRSNDIYEIILGENNDNEKITLYNSLNKSQNILPETAYVGEHFEKVEDLVFNKATIEFTYLADWIKANGFEFSNRTLSKKNVQLSYNPPPERIAHIDRERISINHYLTYQASSQQNIYLEQKVNITIEISNCICLDDILSHYVGPLGNLIELGTDLRNRLESISVFKEDQKGVISNPVEIFFTTTRNDKNESQPSFMLFFLSDIEIGFNQGLNNWFNLYKKKKEVFNLFFSVLNKDIVNIETDFLKLAQAAEAFHAATFPKDKNLVKEFNDNKKRVKATADDDLKDWVEKNIQNHGAVFQKRIAQLVEKTKDVINPLIQDIDDFPEYIKNSRNYFTHHGDPKNAATTTKDLWPLYNALLFMLRACLMMELGIPEERYKDLIESHYKYRYAREQSNTRYKEKIQKEADKEKARREAEEKQHLEANKKNNPKNKHSKGEVY